MNIGAQLYGFEQAYAKKNLEKILSQVKNMGYSGVEMPFMADIAPLLHDLGLDYFALHVAIDDLNDLSNIIPHLHNNHCNNICISGPLGWYDRSIDNFEKSCDFLNKKAQLLHDADIRVHYHNHEFEFTGAPLAIDTLMDKLDTNLVKFCVDTGWMHVAGVDVVSFLTNYQDSVSYVHLRDFRNTKSVPLGQGDVNISGIISVLTGNPAIQWLMVEHEPEEQETAFYNLTNSRNYLKNSFEL